MPNEAEHILPLKECETLITSIFHKAGLPKNLAALVAEYLLLAEMDGQKGHGLARVHSYHAHLVKGIIRKDAQIRAYIDEHRPAILRIDADYGFAYPAIEEAHRKLPALINQYGMAACFIGHSHHAGILGHHVEKLAKQGYIAIMMANTPAAMAASGGKKPIFGTNPIAFAMPRAYHAPLIMDLSLTQVARGKIMQAKAQGQGLQAGWAFDKEGQPTLDPETALQGSLAPIGGVKGTLLAMMVELLTAGLGDSNFGFEADSFFADGNAPPNTAQTIIAFAPPSQAQMHRMERLFETVLQDEDCRLPGDKLVMMRKQAETQGIRLTQADYNQLKNLLSI